MAVMALEEDEGLGALSLAADGEYTLISSPGRFTCGDERSFLWTAKLKVTAPIDMSGITTAQPITAAQHRFSGTFDGNGQTISNLTITSSTGIYRPVWP